MALAEMFREKGYDIKPFPEQADLYVINSCTVTGRSDYKSRNAARRARRSGGPEAVVILTGCFAQRDSENALEIEEIDAVVGNSHKDMIPEIAEKLLASRREKTSRPQRPAECYVNDPGSRGLFFPIVSRFGTYTRAFLKIQDGCDYRCTYCAVPEARGPSRSIPLEEAVSNAERFIEAGYVELVLTGVHLGTFGKERGETLSALVRELCRNDDLRRLRLSSIEPLEFRDDLMHVLCSEPKVAPHFHIPLQSGSRSILHAMGRRYTPGAFSEIITRLADRLPCPGIGTDVLVGFPGETDKDFRRTVALLASLPVTYFHVFSYSPRHGTPAASYPDQVHPQVKKERSKLLKELSRKKNLEFRTGLTGTTQGVLFEKKTGSSDTWSGLTGNYVRVNVRAGVESVGGTIRDVRITGAEDRETRGVLTGKDTVGCSRLQ